MLRSLPAKDVTAFIMNITVRPIRSIFVRVGLMAVMAGLIVVFQAGCKDKDLPHFETSFSCNLIIPGKDFPQKKIKKQLTPIQLKVVEEYGPPDYIRVWWDRYGRVKRLMEVHRQIDNGDYTTKPMTWLYEDEGIEIYFVDKENYRSAPIEPKMKILMTFGDPENVTTTNHNNIYRESWQFYSAGLTIKFNREGNIVDRQEYQGTGAWLKP